MSQKTFTTLTSRLSRSQPLIHPRPHAPPLRPQINRTAPSQPPSSLHLLRTFHTTSSKSKSRNDNHDNKSSSPSPSTATPPSSPSDPLDFTTLIAEQTRILDKLKTELSKVKAGGIDLEAVEKVRVNIGGGQGKEVGAANAKDGKRKGEGKRGKGKGGKEEDDGSGTAMTVALGEVAQVVKKGREVVIMVGEKEHLKPILTTLQSHPTLPPPLPPTPTTPLSFTIPIPPTTSASRTAAATTILAFGAQAQLEMKAARAVAKKRLRGMELGKLVRPDALRKGEKELERVNERGVGGIKGIVEGGRRGVEGGG